MFRGMTSHFENLKSVTFQQEGIYGAITPQTFEGLENIETIRFIDTNIDIVEDSSFVKIRNIKGIIQTDLANS